MTSQHPYSSINLEEVNARNKIARHILAGFAALMPTLVDFWWHLASALADTLKLSAEVTRLATELESARLETANLLAAMRSTLAAYADGEADPLWYLRDEVDARRARSGGHRRAS